MVDSFSQTPAARTMLADYNQGIGDSYVKAITELLTNSHQNYHQYWKELGFDKQKQKPVISIVVDPVGQFFMMTDMGTGIAENMNDLAGLLEEYSSFIEKAHTIKGRSSFGRGMSDVLFRRGVYSNKIFSNKNGKCLAATAEWIDFKVKGKLERRPTFTLDKKCSDDYIKEYVGEHGTCVLFRWEKQVEKYGEFPKKKEILDSLQKYYELKNVLNDEKIDINLYYIDSKDPKPTKLTFVNYQKNASPIGKTLSDISLPINRDYDIRIISAKMLKTKNVILNQEEGEQRTGGLFIEGEHGQIFDLTMFGQEKNYQDASLRLIGEIILSEDAKRYMDNYYTKEGVTILKRTREGFDKKYTFYKELEKKISPWLKGILESESQDSASTTSEQFKNVMKRLDEIGRKELEAKNLETGPEGVVITDGPPPPPPPPVDTIQFSPDSPEIEQAVLCKIFLKINCAKIDPGTKISYRVDGADAAHYDIKWEATRVPKPNKKNIAKIPIYIKCNEIDATAEIVAETKKKNGEKTGEKFCFLKCVEEKQGPPVPTEYLQFIPNHTQVETNIDKQVNLWAHQILNPGTKITIEFTCETHDFEPPITFDNDGRQKIESGKHSFEIKVPDIPLDPNAYRKIPIIFTGTGEGLRGKITADTENSKIIPTTCKIEIISPSNPEGGGLLSGWQIIDSPLQKYAWYEPTKTKIFINTGISFVRTILGKDQTVAEARCNKLQEAQVFVGQTIIDIFFDELVSKMYESRKLTFSIENPDYRESHDTMVYEKQKLMAKWGNEILAMFAPNIRKNVSGGKVREMNFKKENIDFKLWDLELQENIMPPIYFNNLQEFRGKSANMTPVHFEVNGQTFEIGVYEFDGKFVAKMHNYDRDGKYKVVMPEIDNMTQIFKPLKQGCKKIELEDPVFSAVRTVNWVRQPDKNKRLVQEPVKHDQYNKIIEPPELNHANNLLESSSNWRNIQGQPLVQYAKYSDIDQSYANSDVKDNLACFISSGNTIQMAKMFVRTHIAPAFMQFNDLVKTFKDVVAECEDAKCGERAEGVQEILTKIGFHREGENMVINKLCRNCQ